MSAHPTALVVEDEPGIRSLMAKVLERQGFRVDAAANGRDALALLSGCAYQVIVLDLAMPEMTGEELIDHLRDHAPHTLRRIVIVTASLHLLRYGFPDDICRVVTKPFDVATLEAAVADCSTVSSYASS